MNNFKIETLNYLFKPKTSKHIKTGSKNRESLFKRQKNFLSFSNLAESGEESENFTGNMADFRQGLYNIHKE